jgi:hypothetical protein
MTAVPMQLYRVTCDEDGCKTYLNVAAENAAQLKEVVLPSHKWLMLMSTTLCPKHAEQTAT